jgi:hypothetical protein
MAERPGELKCRMDVDSIAARYRAARAKVPALVTFGLDPRVSC